MFEKGFKLLLVAAFSVFSLTVSTGLAAQDGHNPPQHEHGSTPDLEHGKEAPVEGKEGKFDAKEVIFNHVLDGHSFHFFDITNAEGHVHPVGIDLPIIIYEPGRGLSSFSSARFEHGHKDYMGYRLVGNKIVAVSEQTGAVLENRAVYDFSLTRNLIQMFLALIILVVIMLRVAKRYKSGQGVTSAPKGTQNLMETVITFVRDEVAKPNLGHSYGKYLPYLLTVFFFILINNIFGLIPGTANVTGNIAFTVILGVISFLVIVFSGNKHFWGHIFWPPVPHGVKAILIPVEILGIFTKPFALIIRLFANMLAGHIIIICLISLIFIFGGMSAMAGGFFTPVSLAFTIFIYFIEVLVAFIQAFIFTNLTAVFIGQAIEDAHHTVDEAHAGKPATEPVII